MIQPLLLSTWSFGQRSNVPGWKILDKGGSSLDAVEAVGRFAEDDLTNPTVGRGGLPDASGKVSLDASIMLSPAECGAVANMRRFPNPVSVARRVMEKTRHVLLAGEEADQFAEAQGFEAAELLTDEVRELWKAWKRDHPEGASFGPIRNIEELGLGGRDAGGRDAGNAEKKLKVHNIIHDTIGVLAIDAKGTLAGCCTTSGLAYKLPGRVGDSPIVGHGLYVDPAAGCAVATGHGELVMGICGAFLAVELLRNGRSPEQAAVDVLKRVQSNYDLGEEDQLGIIVMNKNGEWSSAALRDGFSVAVRTNDRDELAEPANVLLR